VARRIRFRARAIGLQLSFEKKAMQRNDYFLAMPQTPEPHTP